MSKVFNRDIELEGIFKLYGRLETPGTTEVRVYDKDSSANVKWAEGATVPADAEAGYAKGCMFVQTDGGVGTTWYVNEGSATSADFNAISATSGATTALDNLASVAINLSLISDTDNTDDLGSATKEWKDLYIDGVGYIDTLQTDTIQEDTSANGVVIDGVTCKDNGLIFTGDIAVNTNKFTVTGASGNTVVAGTLGVTGAATFSSTLAVTGASTLTGNVTCAGDLTVSGSLTFGGNWTVAATLTVDELILDTDGSAPAGTNCYAVRDNAGDLTLNAITGKTINLAINNTDEYTFSATVADFLDNAIDNAGYIILNAATAPAGTEVYLVNDNTGDLTLNALAGKKVLIAIAGTDEVALGDGAYVFNDGSADRDFRVESNGMAYAIYSDGGKDALVLGSNTDTSSVDQLITISRAARTATAATNYYDLAIQPAGAVTVPAGTTAVVASLMIAEPNITATGTVTDAASLYISGEPTEGGTGNYGAMIAASIGLIADAKDFVLGAGRDVLMRWSTADADNHAFAIGLGASLAMHICQGADIATDWNVAAASNPTLYIHGATTPATEYLAISDDETDIHINAVGANFSFEIGGTPELTLSASALNLAANTLQGGTGAAGDMTLASTSNATKGCVTIANGEQGFKVGNVTDRATTEGTNQVVIFDGTAPVGTLANGVTLYSASGEFYAMDAAGNATLNSPHTEDGDYIIYSYSAAKKKTITIHLEKLIAAMVAKDASLDKYYEVDDGMRHKAQKVNWKLPVK